MPITSTIQQGTLSLAAVTPGNSAIGDAAAAGTSASVARADHKHGREASGTPVASAVGDTASAGSATTVALSDHRHSREAFGTPGAVTGGATAASGSATTLARSDHVHSTASIPVLLGRTTLGTATNTVTFSSIAQTFTDIQIVGVARGSWTGGASQEAYFRVNGLSTYIYYSSYTSGLDGQLSQPLAASGNYLSTTLSLISIYIYKYTSSTTKITTETYGFNTSASAWSPSWGAQRASAIATTAISSITVTTDNLTDNFVVGSTFSLYGYP